MSDSQFMLSCQNVSIRYRVGDFKNIGLKEWVVRRLTGHYEVMDFWADRDVNFALQKGDMLGIIGTNGAGKSTLLKAVSGIMEPTKGHIFRNGSISALLELGGGFDGELTVRENAYLRGAMFGYTRAFMDDMYEQIISFAELKEFEDRPLKQLSSGMKSRLAFSIASLLKPEILIIDEVLSVGDGAFKAKSEAKMHEIIEGGATTIFVSHMIVQVRKLCNKVLWLDKGRQIVFSDDVAGVCDCYERFLKGDLKEPVYKPAAKVVACAVSRSDGVDKKPRVASPPPQPPPPPPPPPPPSQPAAPMPAAKPAARPRNRLLEIQGILREIDNGIKPLAKEEESLARSAVDRDAMLTTEDQDSALRAELQSRDRELQRLRAECDIYRLFLKKLAKVASGR